MYTLYIIALYTIGFYFLKIPFSFSVVNHCYYNIPEIIS